MKRVPRELVDLGAILALFLLICGPYLLRVSESPIPGGWDGVPHYAIADLYARKIFPSISGWLDEYFAGMPFPDFYPPAFYFIVALLTKLGLSTRTAFLWVQYVASAAVPCLTYLTTRALVSSTSPRRAGDTSRIAGLVAGAVVVGLLRDNHPISRFGITLVSTFEAGLSTQLLGHVFVLAFACAALGVRALGPRAALAALSLGMVPLTNVHMVWSAALIFVAVLGGRLWEAQTRAERARWLGIYLAIGTAGLLLSLCWVLPMLLRLEYVPTQALNPPSPGTLKAVFLRFGIYLGLATVVAMARRDRRALTLSAGLLLLLITFATVPHVHHPAVRNLAIQPLRILGPFPFLVALLVGYLTSAAPALVAGRSFQIAVGLACVGAFFWHFRFASTPEGNVGAEQFASYRRALGALDDPAPGRVLVEMGTDNLSDTFALQALVGMRDRLSMTTVFREASPTVFAAVPLRNAFSSRPEAFGVDHKIDGSAWLSQFPERLAARLRLLGVRFLLLRSPSVKQRVAAFPWARRVGPAGPWELFALELGGVPLATVPSRAPVLTFATYTVKPRPDDQLDFVRLGEEMLASARLEIPLALAREERLDANEDWERFGAALIASYRYDNLERAAAAVQRFAATGHPVILAPSSDPLYGRLLALSAKEKNLRVLPTTCSETPASAASFRLIKGASDRASALDAAAKAAACILDAIDGVTPAVTAAPGVRSVSLAHGITTLELDAPPAAPVPVWIRQSYFPGWSRDSSEPIYLATPTFQLTFATSKSVALHLNPSRGALVGKGLSAFGLVALLLLVAPFILGAFRRGNGAPERVPRDSAGEDLLPAGAISAPGCESRRAAGNRASRRRWHEA